MRKGKTHRNRKSATRFQDKISHIDDQTDVVNLNRWIKRVGFKLTKKVRLVEFPETGRGVMALENVKSSDVLLEVPFRGIICLITLENDANFKSLLFGTSVADRAKCSFQELVAFYLAYVKTHIAEYPFWLHYLNTLPKKFTLPYFYKSASTDFLDESIIKIVEFQKERVSTSYTYFRNIILEVAKVNDKFSYFLEKFSLDTYEWAYFIVNTRCVYMDLTNICKTCDSTERNLYTIISDRPNLGLIPYLDLFNHSPEAKTLTGLKLIPEDQTSESRPLHKINILDELYFELKTLTEVKKYDQIYISYGDHCNLKLLTEYGFIVPHNPFKTVALSFEDICRSMKKDVKVSSLSQEKYKFIKKYSLDENLHIGVNGFSYNFLRFLFVLAIDDRHAWISKIFTNNFSKIELDLMYVIGMEVSLDRRRYLEEKINKFSAMNLDDISYDFSVDLMKEYIYLIDNLKCS
ncbi:SET domain-containing protein 4 [Arctopsyche grandis]|uniref:SET domain-containing protein 4 n=1 Tax=Arctopsyche grandis TaxID=121162 RepID=UPI00406D7F74